MKEEVYPNSVDEEGRTLLSWSAGKGYEEMTQMLLQEGAKPDGRDRHRGTALNRAAEGGHLEVVRMLLEMGATVDVPEERAISGLEDIMGDTPLLLAARGRHAAVALLLINNGGELEPMSDPGRIWLYQAAVDGDTVAARQLLDKGADDTVCINGQTPIFWAIEGGHEPVFRLLLERTADLDYKNNRGETLLFYATQRSRQGIMELLLERGADTELTNSDGLTPLSAAVKMVDKAAVQLLLDYDANAISRDKLGRTPLWHAATEGHTAIMELLLVKDSDTELADNDGHFHYD
ncbi:ankyrin repeat-containing domain protein [Nemania sp. NC0429]|nr:ankyrin repeat-containing domain protein [Nemania sp. NC0429]